MSGNLSGLWGDQCWGGLLCSVCHEQVFPEWRGRFKKSNLTRFRDRHIPLERFRVLWMVAKRAIEHWNLTPAGKSLVHVVAELGGGEGSPYGRPIGSKVVSGGLQR